MVENKQRWRVNPEAEYLTEDLQEFSPENLVQMFRKLAILKEMGTPANDDQRIVFDIIAEGILAEEVGGPNLRAEVLGVNIGRLERNTQFWTDSVPEDKRWEPRVIAELAVEVERVQSYGYSETFEAARDNVLYGTWRKFNMFDYYLYCLNEHPWNEVHPILHQWFEKYVIEDAINITPKPPLLLK